MATMKTTMPFTEKDSAIKHLSDISYYFSMSYQEQQRYFHERDAEITYNNMMNKKRDTFLAEGRAEGEKLKAIETAKKMKEKNMSIEDIIYVSGLTKEEIEAL